MIVEFVFFCGDYVPFVPDKHDKLLLVYMEIFCLILIIGE